MCLYVCMYVCMCVCVCVCVPWYPDEQAATAFLCAADCHRQLKSPHEAASALVEAAAAYKRFDPKSFVFVLMGLDVPE